MTVIDQCIDPAVSESVRMRVSKRDGSLEDVDVNKIVRAVARNVVGLDGVDPVRVAVRTISGLFDGASTEELDALSIRTAAALITEEPNYSRLAARLLSGVIDKEVGNQDVHSFSQSIAEGHAQGIIGQATADFVSRYARKLNDAVKDERSDLFEFFGLRTVYDRYLLRHPESRHVIETPQYFFLRVACGLSRTPDEAIELYELMSCLEYLPSSPTLFNSGTIHEQMSSCYLLDSPQDNLDSIYHAYGEVARLSKFAGGIGVAFTRIRSRGSLIKGTNGLSSGIVPWLKTLDSSVQAVNQGGRRKGAACVYLETWHADIEEFLELRDNAGDESRRARHINLANWIPDLFMRRVEQDTAWSLFDPKVVPHLPDLFGEAFDQAYERAETEGLFVRQVPARQIYGRMMRTLAETGNGWMTFKDASNRTCNQALEGRTVHLSNLCTEILEVNSEDETAVCNLGSINLARLVRAGEFDFGRLGEIVRTAVPFLDRVIDRNFYPTPRTRYSNTRWRPIGLGVMGLADVFFQLAMPFDSPEARALSQRISEEVYFHALSASIDLAEESGAHEMFAATHAAHGRLQFDLWGVVPSNTSRWNDLRTRVVSSGLRNSLLIAVAPTATIASIAGCYECIEPQVSNFFKRETLSGEFMQINTYLVRDLQQRGLWNDDVRTRIKHGDGSVQHLSELPESVRSMYRTAWEIPMRSLIDMASDRGAFIDQSQSLNLFVAAPNIGKLSSMYLYAWQKNLKTTYYLRSRPATRIAMTTTEPFSAASDAVTCSLENPETCEACD